MMYVFYAICIIYETMLLIYDWKQKVTETRNAVSQNHICEHVAKLCWVKRGSSSAGNHGRNRKNCRGIKSHRFTGSESKGGRRKRRHQKTSSGAAGSNGVP